MNKLQELLATSRQKKLALLSCATPINPAVSVSEETTCHGPTFSSATGTDLPTGNTNLISTAAHFPGNSCHHHGTGKNGEPIEYNAEQWEFVQTVLEGKSCILIGAAGTGKTTSAHGALSSLLREKYIPKLGHSHKYLSHDSPAIVAVSYTRRAVMNLKQALPPELKENAITIHKLLEYQPVIYEVFDEETGQFRKTMRFEPNRHRLNKLPDTIRTIIFDESSMVSVELFHQVWCALEDPHSVQFIFLGDIQQLPPVFGSAILGYKMLKLPTVELTQVYRQALESPIIRLAHRILSGNGIASSELPAWEVPGQLKLHAWKKKISPDSALLTVAAFFRQALDAGHYTPETDTILMPFNKACGTEELNRHIASHLASSAGSPVYEVIAGFNKHYFRVGERVLYEKEDAIITNITRNPTYAGRWPQPSSRNMNYWGHIVASEEESALELTPDAEQQGESDADVDAMLAALANSDVEDRVREASHIVTLRLLSSDQEQELKTASAINSLILSYALTVHKSQGSEWKKVYLILHHSHNTMLQRELLYTACTRARQELYVICEPDSFEKGIRSQRIRGDSLAEKKEFFKGKLQAGEESLLEEIL